MKNAVIVTAKGSNISIQNKNLIPVLGHPVVSYPIRAAKQSAKTSAIFLSTEDPLIKDVGIKENIHIIDRPQELAASDSQHKDVIEHAVRHVQKQFPTLENVIVLLGNTVMIHYALIDKCFSILEEGSHDSCLTAWKAQDDHPYRALTLDPEGNVQSFLNKTSNSNRQSYPDVYFYDQGIWAFKKDCALKKEGPSPWVWLGKKCKLIERPWVTGRDIHSWIDVAASNWYLNSIQPYEFIELT